MTIGDLIRHSSNKILAVVLSGLVYLYYLDVLEILSDLFGYKIEDSDSIEKDKLYYGFLEVLNSEAPAELQQGDTK